MPEGPEVRRVTDWLTKRLVTDWSECPTHIDMWDVSGGRYSREVPTGHVEFLEALREETFAIREIGCKGKLIYFCLADPWGDTTERWWVHSTLGMTGMWNAGPTDHVTSIVATHAWDGRDIEEYTELRTCFNDPRHFGTLTFTNDERKHTRKLANLGPDILATGDSDPIIDESWARIKPMTVCEALMDQKVVSGIGNYIKAEGLWRAGISPWTLTRDITFLQWGELLRHCREVAQASYEMGGATIRNYHLPTGEDGKYEMRVYGRKIDALGREVTVEPTPDGRTTWWVKPCT